MGLHFIKNGTKHDVCVKRPSLFPASATTYDNSQSGLSATRVQGAIDEVEGQIANSSDAYSSSKAYAVGDYCIYNGTLYRCITACTAASWSVNSSCFTADTVVGALGTIGEVVLSSVTSDGVKTYSQMLDELFTAVSSVALISKHSKLSIGTHILGISCLDTANGYAIFSSYEYEEVYITMQSFRNVVLRSSGSKFTIYRVDNVNTTPTQSFVDVSTNVPSSGAVYTLYK